MNLQVGKAIYKILSESLESKVQIYPLVADNGTTFPFIVYRRRSILPATSKDRFVYQSCATYEISIASDNYNETIEIADNVIQILNGIKGTYNDIDIQNIEVFDASEDFIDDTYTQTLTLKLYINYGRNYTGK